MDNIQDTLNQSAFLSGCEISHDLIIIRNYKKGAYVSDLIDDTPCVVLVHSGIISVFLLSVDGKETHLNNLSRGSCFGVSNLLCKYDLETTLQCKTDTTLLYIPKKRVIEIMQSNSTLAMKYATYCNEKINFLIQRIEYLSIQSVEEKLIQYILVNNTTKNIVHLDTSKEKLASYLGASRASLYRELSKLENLGMINYSKDAIFVLDENALKNMLYKSI